MGKATDVLDSVVHGVVGWRNPKKQWQETKDGAASLVADNNGAAYRVAQAMKNNPSRIDQEIERQSGGVEATGGSTLKSTIRQEREAGLLNKDD